MIGLGAFGSAVAGELARFGNQVIGVDLDERRVSAMASTLSAAVILDTTDDMALKEAGIDQYDVALIAIGRDIERRVLAKAVKLYAEDRIFIVGNRTVIFN